jgi:hypothetical protein
MERLASSLFIEETYEDAGPTLQPHEVVVARWSGQAWIRHEDRPQGSLYGVTVWRHAAAKIWVGSAGQIRLTPFNTAGAFVHA